jgi:hypothetical protein
LTDEKTRDPLREKNNGEDNRRGNGPEGDLNPIATLAASSSTQNLDKPNREQDDGKNEKFRLEPCEEGAQAQRSHCRGKAPRQAAYKCRQRAHYRGDGSKGGCCADSFHE